MVTLCWAAKGGSGTTVVTSTLTLDPSRRSLLVDLAGEVPLVLGLPEPDRPGVVDWLIGDGPASQLADLTVDISDTAALLPRAAGHDRTAGPQQLDDIDPQRWRQLADWLEQWQQRNEGQVWIDAGTGTPPAQLVELIADRWLVTRQCYLALQRAAESAVRPTGVVLIVEPGRSLRAQEVERSANAPIVARVSHDPKMARAVDAGLIRNRPPLTIRRQLRHAVA
jgi:hypothetical protein